MRTVGKITQAPGARLLALGVLFVGPLALAQQGETNGIKIGEGRVHPYFDLELRFDSAAGFFSGSAAAGTLPLRGEFITHARPGLKLELLTPSTVLNVAANVEYVYYTGILSSGSQQASRFQTDTGVNAAFNKTGAVEFQLSDHLVRSDRTGNPAATIGILSLFNEARLGVPIHPGGGALEVTPSAAWAVELFESPSSVATPGCATGDPTCSTAALNYNNFHYGLGGRWRFLPKTALVLDTSLDNRYYTIGTPAPTLLFKVEGGLTGLVSAKIAVILKAGYGHDFSTSGARTVVGHAELTYMLSETAKFKVGYLRTIEPVSVFGAFGDDRGYAEGRFLFGGRLTVHASAAYDYLSFYGGSGRNDRNISADVGPEYQFKPWLFGSLGYVLTVRVSSNASQAANFPRNEGYGRLTLTY